jgi:hypothetical protein
LNESNETIQWRNKEEMRMKYVNIDEELSVYEMNKLYEANEEFQLTTSDSKNRNRTTLVDAMNLLLHNREFIKINALITKQESIIDYYEEFRKYIQHTLSGIEFGLGLESNTINGIYLRAYFTKSELETMKAFRKYDEDEFVKRIPDFNYDIRVVRRASMDLLLSVLLSPRNYKNLMLSRVCIWDYLFVVL